MQQEFDDNDNGGGSSIRMCEWSAFTIAIMALKPRITIKLLIDFDVDFYLHCEHFLIL